MNSVQPIAISTVRLGSVRRECSFCMRLLNRSCEAAVPQEVWLLYVMLVIIVVLCILSYFSPSACETKEGKKGGTL